MFGRVTKHYVPVSVLVSLLTVGPCLAREWADSTGNFKVEADFVSNIGGNITLRKPNGVEIVVPLAKLSAKDQKFLADAAGGTLAAESTVLRVGHAAVMEALAKKVTLAASGLTLSEAVKRLQKAAGVPIICDHRYIDASGNVAERKIDVSAENRPLRDVLMNLAPESELVPICREELIYLTTKRRSQTPEMMDVRVYQLLERKADTDPIYGDLLRMQPPKTWQDVGGPGGMVILYPRMVISQSDEMHSIIQAQFTHRLRPIDIDSKSVVPILREWSVCQRAIALPVREFTFAKTPLGDVAKQLGESHRIEVNLDEQGLSAIELSRTTEIDFEISAVRLQLALDLLFEKYSLGFIPTPTGLQITSKNAATQKTVEAKYNVKDLLAGRPNDIELYQAAIYKNIHPASWERVGGVGKIGNNKASGELVVTHNFATHLKVQRMLAGLRARDVK